jgi:hypothetical protein
MRINLLLMLTLAFTQVNHSVWAQGAERISNEALADAIYSSGLAGLKSRLSPPSGAVVKIGSGVCYISNDSATKLAIGTRLTIVREKETIIHPDTGEKLGAITEPVGSVKVLTVTDKLITAALEKNVKIAIGDTIDQDQSQKPHVALTALFSLTSWEPNKVLGAVNEKLSGWSHVTWAPHHEMERFLYDENISGREQMVTENSFESLRKNLKADFLIVLDVKEENGTVLTDVALYELLKGASPIALSKGLSLKTGGEPLVASSIKSKSRRKAKPAPAPIVPSAPPKQEPDKQAKVKVKRARVATSIKPGPRERRIESFDKSISALLAYDLDGDGEKEIVVGFANQIALFKLNKDGVAKVWEKDFKSSEQITGFGAGDFNGNGKVEIYVNKVTASSKIKSFVLEVDGGSYRVLTDDQPILFYSGDDGKLYGQGQNKNRSLKESIDRLSWDGARLTSKHFANLLPKKRLSGIGFFDLDEDGVTDISGYDVNHKFVYHSSAGKRWARPMGKFGGSNIAMEIPVESRLYTSEEDERKQYQEFVGPPILSTGPDGRLTIFAIRNKSPFPFAARPKYTKSQVIVLEYSGATYTKRSETTIAKGAVHGYALIDDSAPGLILVARNYYSIFGKERSELILLDINQF